MSITDSSLRTLPISFIFIYLPMKDHVKNQRRSFLQRENVANQGLFYPLTVPISNNALSEKRNALLSTEISKSICYSGRV